ncbi:MAG: bifunctional phosphoribosylaminoimidazolecarboxamide formyltransferase/IMP cyclohydrolase, partial [Planctomycetota bacterium]
MRRLTTEPPQLSPPIRRALISVSDKTGLVEFGRELSERGVELYSTGGSAFALQEAGVPVREVSEHTGFPEMMGGRLKTLHPLVHGGVLCRHDNPDDMAAAAEHGIATFELVVVNLYPFRETVARRGVTFAESIEKIDIGGPTLVRGAAKNHAFVTIASSPGQYAEVLAQVKADGKTTPELRQRLAAEAFAHTA